MYRGTLYCVKKKGQVINHDNNYTVRPGLGVFSLWKYEPITLHVTGKSM